jgi:uncharacterized protein (TIGR02996 family)
MTTGEAILAAIIAKPKEDTPRLVYADFLEEEGQSDRAEFIRVQIELAQCFTTLCTSKKLAPCYSQSNRAMCDGCERKTWLLKRERELFDILSESMWPVWITSPKHLRCEQHEQYDLPTQFMVRRGFISNLTCSWIDCFGHLDEIRKHCPIERVRLTDRPELRFGPVGTTSRNDRAMLLRITIATWNVFFEQSIIDRQSIQYAQSERELEASRDHAYVKEYWSRKIERARTPEGYCKSKWEGIEFEMPSVQQVVMDAGPVRFTDLRDAENLPRPPMIRPGAPIRR